MAYTPVTVKPKDGGHLITRGSSSEVGLANYTVKRDFRRNLDRERRREGCDHFWGNQNKALGNQPFPNHPITGEPIVLVHLARRPNGAQAIIVGTETKLWRFFSMDDGRYVLGDENGIYVNGDINGDYFEENPGDWLLIGSGFRSWKDGAHRWEAVQINGTSYFNNGADLLQQYRLEWMAVKPVYELREQGIARVGTIEAYKEILMLADITEIDADKLKANFALVDSGLITAAQTGSLYSGLTLGAQTAGSDIVTTAGGTFAFTIGMVGRTIRFTNGWRSQITAFVDANHVHISNAPVHNISARPFWVINESTDYTVLSSAPIFTASDRGRQILWDTGEVRRIVQVVSASEVKVDRDWTVAGGPFSLENTTAYGYYAGGGFQRRQWRVLWSLPMDGSRFGASVPCKLGAGTNRIVLDYPVKSFSVGDEVSIVDQDVGVYRLARVGQTVTAYTREKHTYTNTQVKISGAEQGEYNGTFVISNVTQRSFQYQITGEPVTPATSATGVFLAGGSILTANVVAVRELGKVLVLDTTATEPFNNAEVIRSDVEGSILGFEDITEEGGGILRMLELQGALVIYKDTSIALGSYTANVDQPFLFETRKVPSNSTLHYRWTLVSVQGQWHLFAGRNGFFRYDLTRQNPDELAVFDWMANTFFDVAKIDDSNEIWAADNSITKEIVISLGQGDYEYLQDRKICYDYKYGTISTSSLQATAAATVKRPESDLSVGETEDWFVMGGPTGEVLIYGLVDKALPQFGESKQIFYRREGQDTVTKNGYASAIKGGLSAFGDEYNEKDICSFVLLLASQSTTECPIYFELFGAINASDGVSLLTTKTLNKPQKENLVPVFYRQNAFQPAITVNGKDNPVEIVGWVWSVDGVKSASITRRPTA